MQTIRHMICFIIVLIAFCTSACANSHDDTLPYSNLEKMLAATIAKVQSFNFQIMGRDASGRATKFISDGKNIEFIYDVAGKIESWRVDDELMHVRIAADTKGSPVLRLFSEGWTELPPLRLAAQGITKNSPELSAYRNNYVAADKVDLDALEAMQTQVTDNRLAEMLSSHPNRLQRKYFGDPDDGYPGPTGPIHPILTPTPPRICVLKCDRDGDLARNVCQTTADVGAAMCSGIPSIGGGVCTSAMVAERGRCIERAIDARYTCLLSCN